MITRITGRLVTLLNDAAVIAAGAFEYEVYVPEFVRRQLQGKIGEEVSLRTIEYLEGNPGRGNLTPRMIGFASDAEREFFDAICSVDGVGVKKALRAMVRPVREVAVAIEEQDVKQLSTLPGIGAGLAERIIAKLRRKMAKFALLIQRELPPEREGERGVINDAYDALLSLGHSAPDARAKIEKVAVDGKKFKSVEDLLEEIYRSQQR
ncbi:MAG TPA: Holliday junction branch migration protein RuvA [Planctomycetaceae bacterium]|jgi:Holliday junction DNA helicase RuvA|nr:Holliday junction branch migration protein RuvA [Planctomycetaceae bacterium]